MALAHREPDTADESSRLTVVVGTVLLRPLPL